MNKPINLIKLNKQQKKLTNQKSNFNARTVTPIYSNINSKDRDTKFN